MNSGHRRAAVLLALLVALALSGPTGSFAAELRANSFVSGNAAVTTLDSYQMGALSSQTDGGQTEPGNLAQASTKPLEADSPVMLALIALGMLALGRALLLGARG